MILIEFWCHYLDYASLKMYVLLHLIAFRVEFYQNIYGLSPLSFSSQSWKIESCSNFYFICISFLKFPWFLFSPRFWIFLWYSLSDCFYYLTRFRKYSWIISLKSFLFIFIFLIYILNVIHLFLNNFVVLVFSHTWQFIFDSVLTPGKSIVSA